MDIKAVLGVAAGIIVMIGTVPYLRDILRGETKPSRATWTLLTLLLIISAFVQGELGTGWAMALVIGEIIACGSVAVLSIKRGYGGFELTDKICYVLWAVSVVLWLVLDRPLWALQLSLFADLVSMVPTLIKTKQNPEEESANVFIASAFAGLLGIFAATSFDYQNIIFPSYILIINSVEVSLIIYAKRLKAAQ